MNATTKTAMEAEMILQEFGGWWREVLLSDKTMGFEVSDDEGYIEDTGRDGWREDSPLETE